VKIWRDRNLKIKEMESIFHSLKEAIITINFDGVNFSNHHGKKILKDIENFQGDHHRQQPITKLCSSLDTYNAKQKT
jgi:hypothetical protein